MVIGQISEKYVVNLGNRVIHPDALDLELMIFIMLTW